MNVLIFTGRVAESPALTQHGDTSVCRFTLIRNEYRGVDGTGNARDERKVAIPFALFRGRADAFAKNVRTGDQVIVQARIENNDYADKDGNTKHGYNFVADDWEFGAPGAQSRALLESRRPEA